MHPLMPYPKPPPKTNASHIDRDTFPLHLLQLVVDLDLAVEEVAASICGAFANERVAIIYNCDTEDGVLVILEQLARHCPEWLWSAAEILVGEGELRVH